MMTPFALKVSAAAFLAGWLVSSWQHDSVELAAKKAATMVAEAESGKRLEQAEVLDKTLSRLQANERTIIKENVKIVDRPVYRNICIDDDGMRNANAAKNGGTVKPSDGVQNP